MIQCPKKIGGDFFSRWLLDANDGNCFRLVNWAENNLLIPDRILLIDRILLCGLCTWGGGEYVGK